MRNPHGYVEVQGPPGEQLVDPRGDEGLAALARDHECDTVQCFHCQRTDHIKPFCDPADLGGVCGGCGQHICKRCVEVMWHSGKCEPFEKVLERLESRHESLRSYSL